MITTEQLVKKYGFPDKNPNYLVSLNLPYPMRLSWDREVKVNRIQCHKKVKDNLELIFKELLNYYGYEKIVELGIDLYGGCFNFRKMRGGNDFSRHSWGVAIDLDPERNQLKTPYLKSNFSKPEYKKLHEIFEKNGFVNLGKEKGYDAMHFEIKE